MPRRAAAQQRPVEADPVHRSKLVQQVINRVMLDGKKSTAERIVYDALAILAERTGKEPVQALEDSIKALTRNVGGDLDPAGEAHTGHLAKRGVRLLRGGGVHTRANTAALRGTLQRGRLVLLDLVLPALSDQLLDRRHRFSVFCVPRLRKTNLR
jgi:hypothetical protein